MAGARGEARRRSRPRGRSALNPRGEAANKPELLAALGDVFRAHGYEGATPTLITTATGLGKGSLYNIFPCGKRRWRPRRSPGSTAGFAGIGADAVPRLLAPEGAVGAREG